MNAKRFAVVCVCVFVCGMMLDTALTILGSALLLGAFGIFVLIKSLGR